MMGWWCTSNCSCRVEQYLGMVSFSNSIPNNYSQKCSSHSSTIIINRRTAVVAAAASCQLTSPPPPASTLSICHTSTTSIASLNDKMRERRRRRATVIRVSKSESASSSNIKIANLSASRKETFKLPIFDDGRGLLYPINEFLTHPNAVESVLNTSAFQSFQQLDPNTYRCALPGIQLLNFEVAPVLELRVTPTSEDCIVEMLSCKFEGSEALRHYNDHFSAFMRNRITWNTDASEPCLDIDVKVDISLEIYTRPFTYLPTSAVETPGNLVIQSMVDRLVPLLLQQLLQDYEKWVQEHNHPQPILTG